jgi:hypothetical protein
MITVEEIQHYLDTHDDGVLMSGAHSPESRQYCALECITQLRGHEKWSDSPINAGMPDIRPINDAMWSSNTVRTQAMLPMLAAISLWKDWTDHERQQFVSAVTIRTVREVIAMLSVLPEDIRQQCKAVKTLQDAWAAAEAAEAAGEAARAAAEAAWAAGTAAWEAAGTAAGTAAGAAAGAAAEAAGEAEMADDMLAHVCIMWTEEADKIARR